MHKKAQEIRAYLGESAYKLTMGCIILIAANDPNVTDEHYRTVADVTAKLRHSGRGDIADLIDEAFENAVTGKAKEINHLFED